MQVAFGVRPQRVSLEGQLVRVPQLAGAGEAQVRGHVLDVAVLEAELPATLRALEWLTRGSRLVPQAHLTEMSETK